MKKIILLAAVCVFFAACGGDDGLTPTPQKPPKQEETTEVKAADIVKYFGLDKQLNVNQAIEKAKADGPVEKLVGFEMIDKGIPRQHYPIVDAAGNTIGEVTSGTMSPSLKLGIGMGYVKKEFSKTDTEIFIQVRGKNLKAKVVKLPFYKK